MRKLFCDGAIYGYHSMSETSCIISKRKKVCNHVICIHLQYKSRENESCIVSS